MYPRREATDGNFRLGCELGKDLQHIHHPPRLVPNQDTHGHGSSSLTSVCQVEEDIDTPLPEAVFSQECEVIRFL